MKPLKKLPISPAQARAELSRRSFYYFLKEFWEVIIPEIPVYNWHIEYLCNELQLLAERVVRREAKEYDLIINIPPGTTKSTITTIMFPVWCWVKDPTMRFITGSYSSDLSTDHSVKSRDIIRSDKFKEYFGEVILKTDKDNKTDYENNYTGSRSSTSVGGTITGKHAHIIIVDDPLNAKKAASEVERSTANKWLDDTLSTRKVNKEITPTILIMQRLHEQDCTGHWLAKTGKRIKHICLPAEDGEGVKPPELRERYVNGLLDPVRLSRSILDESRIDLGSYGYAGQMQQQPAPDDGGILKREWFNIIDYSDFLKIENADKCVWEFFIDSAYTEKTTNDPTALMAVAIIGNCAYIRSSKQVWLEFPQLIKEIISFTAQNGYGERSRIHVEPKASGLSIVQQIRKETALKVVELPPPKDDKMSRVSAISPIVESKRVYLIRGNWNESLIHECCVFPNGEHDDQVDNLSAMLIKFFPYKKRLAFA